MQLSPEKFKAQVDAITVQLETASAAVAFDGRLGEAGIMLAAAQAIHVLFALAFPPPPPVTEPVATPGEGAPPPGEA